MVRDESRWEKTWTGVGVSWREEGRKVRGSKTEYMYVNERGKGRKDARSEGEEGAGV